MNQQKLNELADLALADLPGAWNIPDEFLARYTELIVKECMKLNHDHFSDEDPYSIDSLYRQHFGVKE